MLWAASPSCWEEEHPSIEKAIGESWAGSCACRCHGLLELHYLWQIMRTAMRRGFRHRWRWWAMDMHEGTLSRRALTPHICQRRLSSWLLDLVAHNGRSEVISTSSSCSVTLTLRIVLETDASRRSTDDAFAKRQLVCLVWNPNIILAGDVRRTVPVAGHPEQSIAPLPHTHTHTHLHTPSLSLLTDAATPVIPSIASVVLSWPASLHFVENRL